MTEAHLTFDDGPSEWTGKILDLLADHDVKASFFWVGEHILQWPDLLERAILEGHRVGGHTWSHRRLSTLGQREAKQEISGPIQLVTLLTDEAPVVWRAPYFDTAGLAPWAEQRFGVQHVGADIVPDDWSSKDPEALAAVVLAASAPGRIVSLHDGIPPDGGSESCTDSRAVTVEAVRLILEGS